MKHSFFLGVLLLVAPANHSGSSRAIMYNVCSVHGGGGGGGGECSVHRGYHEYIGGIMSTSGMFNTSEGYNDVSGGYYDSCGRIS